MDRCDADKIVKLLAPSLDEGIEEVMNSLPQARVVKLCVGEKIHWMKQSERHKTLKKRLKKGDGSEALRRERDNLQSLADKGVPVPTVVAFTDDYLVIDDCGVTLADLLMSPNYSAMEGLTAFYAAGRALSRLHRQGLALGRGKAKDFCWDGKAIHFIDLEEDPKAFDPRTHGRMNLFNFVYYTFYAALKQQRDVYAELRSFMRGYTEVVDKATTQTLESVRTWARRRWWLAAVTLPIGFLKPLGRSPDFKATAPTLIFFSYYVLEGQE